LAGNRNGKTERVPRLRIFLAIKDEHIISPGKNFCLGRDVFYLCHCEALPHLWKCLWHFYIWHVEFWHLEFRDPVVRYVNQRASVFRRLGFWGGSRGFLVRPPDAALDAGCQWARQRRVSVRLSLQLSRHRPVRRLIDPLDAILEAGKRSRREVAVIFNCIPTGLNTAHVRFVLADVVR
jgi:hypothetical protein